MDLLPLSMLLLALAAAGAPLLARPLPRKSAWPWFVVASLAATAFVWSLLAGAYAAGGAAAAALLVVITVPVGAVAARAMGRAWAVSTPVQLHVEGAPFGSGQGRRRGIAVALTTVALAAGTTAAGLGVLGAGLLLGTLAWFLLERGATPAVAVAIAVPVTTAAYVVLARLLLSPLGLVGNGWATCALLGAATVAMGARSRPVSIKAARARTTSLDVVAISAGMATTAGWILAFRGQGDLQDLATLTRLGEDNVSHILMLEATSSGSVLGGSPASLEVSTHFAGYFPGAASLGAAVRGLLPPGASAISAYTLLTALLLGLLVLGMLSAARLTAGSKGPLAAVLLASLGSLVTWVVYGQFTRGFPGQLLVASWLVVALLLVLRHEQRPPANESRRQRLTLVVLLALVSLAAWWTWNLLVPLLLLTAVVLIWPPLSARFGVRRVGIAFGIVAVLVLGGAASVGRSAVVTILDELSTPGGVDTSIPFWVAFSLAAAFGVVLGVTGLHRTPATAVLVAGAVLLTAVLVAWQTARTGGPTYYAYKVEYLVLALASVGMAMGCVPVARALAGGTPPLSRMLTGIVSIATVVVLVAAPAITFARSLRTTGVVPASGPLVCALDAARQHPGAAAVAYGFGSPTEDYLATRAMSVATGNDRTAPLWTSVITGRAPGQLDWSSVVGPRVLVLGPALKSPISLPPGADVEVDAGSCSTAS